MKKPYKILDHTADIGIMVYGRTEKELFANAGFALFDIMVDLAQVKEKEEVEVLAEGPDREDLFLNWLRELLSLFYSKRLLLKRFDRIEIDDIRVKGVGHGETLDWSRHIMRKEIKAATYHKLMVEKTRRGWKAQIIFDI